jgi:hypothetical protein
VLWLCAAGGEVRCRRAGSIEQAHTLLWQEILKNNRRMQLLKKPPGHKAKVQGANNVQYKTL